MDPERANDTLQEGRSALKELEKQLKSSNRRAPSAPPIRSTVSPKESIPIFNNSGSRQNLNSERKILDQVPRNTRLDLRKGSPLGLTLEELDDRGLLDGGGSIPSYYSSIKQKARRSQELRRRSSRLQDREKNVMKK